MRVSQSRAACSCSAPGGIGGGAGLQPLQLAGLGHDPIGERLLPGGDSA